jgi:predicted transcriptional regulator YheO
MTETELIFTNLVKIADSIAFLFGKNCEACIHELSSLQKSLVYIAGNVTGRPIGTPATDLLIKRLEENATPQDMHNYKTTTSEGRSLKSSTTFVSDRNGKPVAALCINFDTTELYNASQALAPFLHLAEDQSTNQETFSHFDGETVEAIFTQAVERVGKHPATMAVEEKTLLISLLEENGIFQLKGAVEEVAHLMGVTKFTVYNYLKKVRNHAFI